MLALTYILSACALAYLLWQLRDDSGDSDTPWKQ